MDAPYIVGNWKMNGTMAMLAEIETMVSRVSAGLPVAADLAVAPPFTLIHSAHQVATHQGSGQQAANVIAIGAQDCHVAQGGAHTGDVSAQICADAGAGFVIVGHSERRQDHGEDNGLVSAKAVAALSAGLEVILCCGESEETRIAGGAEAFVVDQIRNSLPDFSQLPSSPNKSDSADSADSADSTCLASSTSQVLTIAYEPIWAIGTGRVPSVENVASMHAAIRALLVDVFGDEEGAKIRILYGGSVNPGNAKELLNVPNVNGALVGGASLKAASFLGIVEALV